MRETEERMKDLPKFPFYPIVVVILLTTASFFALWSINSDNLRALEVMVHEDYKMLDLTQTVICLNKLSTMSARMYLLTGDEKWTKDFEAYETSIDRIFTELQKFSNTAETEKIIQEIIKAGEKIEEEERKVFVLIHQNKIELAKQILLSKYYDELGFVYESALKKLSDIFRDRSENHMNKEIGETVYVKFLVIGIVLLWILVFTIAYKRVIHWKKTLQNAFQQIAFSEARHRILMSNATCVIITADTNGSILDINKEGEILLGQQKEILIGKSLLDFILEDDRDDISTEVKQLKDNATVSLNEISIIDAQNRSHEVDASMVRVNLGNESLILIIVTDITEKNRLRAQSILNDRLSNMGILAAGIAHELNNPLAWIKSNLQLLKTDLDQFRKKPDQLKVLESFEESITSMIEGSKRVSEIVDNFRSFTRVDDVEINPTNVNEVLESAVNMVLPELKKYAKLEKNLAVDLPKIKINKGRLHQVFINLLINSFQAMQNNNVNQNIIRVKTYQEADRVCISIQDTGEGIPKEILPHIFDLFFTTKPVGKGTGFGLSISHDIIQKFGGEIKVESEVSTGTTFFVYLPIVQKEPNEKQTKAIK